MIESDQFEEELNEESNEEFEYSFKDKKILVVEDNEINTYYFLEILRKTGARLVYAKNGIEAIEKVNFLPGIDLILMDIKMPEMNGYEAFDEIRKINKNVPIIAQTAYALENDRETILNYGFNDYITKPIDRNLLYTILQKHLDNKASV
jgi:CheY-like chemotaxis protein